MDKNILYKTLRRLFSGKATKEEIRDINSWYDSYDTEEKTIIEDYKNRSRQEIRNELFTNIQAKSGIQSLERTRRIRNITLGLAASLCIGLFTLAWRISSPSVSKQQQDTFISFDNGVGMIKKVKLPDGSSVQLHHNSTIEVNKNFSQNRSVYLKGKAFFDVKPNEDLPFTIETNTFKTTVLGTSFSVESRLGGIERVAVKSGKVVVKTDEFGEVRLGKFESVELNNSQLSQNTIRNADLEFGWTDKTIVFDNTEVSSMIQQIEDWYGVKISCNCKDLPKRKISGAYKDMSLEVLLTAIQFSIPLKFEINEEKIQIEFQECK
ncbi:FecR family protein [Belliella marina]|uniref:FecR family protein n=1 Tax=Belliella marina TaxID=1644146 RepID=A0ABW4VMU6_9BACT